MSEEVRRQLSGLPSPERSPVKRDSRTCIHRDLQPEVECACQQIADYLLDLAQDGEAQPALQYILDALDESLDPTDRDVRERVDRVNDALFARHLRWGARADTQRRSGVDPYFWG